jgi:hypothetical protein
VAVEFGGGDVRMLLEMLLAFAKGLANVVAQLDFDGIGAENKGTAEVRLPFLKDRA